MIKGINNTIIVEKVKEYEVVTVWEARHQCIGDVTETIIKEDIDRGIPIICMLCTKDIVIFN